MKEYTPTPVDTSDVKLPDELLPLVEDMARNVHDVWAENRINEGWTYGPTRDDSTRKHPCLIDYADLPENEREYDRATSQETLKLILKKGFTIEKKKNAGHRKGLDLCLRRDFISYILLPAARFDTDAATATLLAAAERALGIRNLKRTITLLINNRLKLELLRDNNNRLVNELPTWLNPDLPALIADEFKQHLHAAHITDAPERALMPTIEKYVWAQGLPGTADALESFLKTAAQQADYYASCAPAPVDQRIIDETYKAAAKITLRERIEKDNCEDILALRIALAKHADAICKTLLYTHLATFFRRLADSSLLREKISLYRAIASWAESALPSVLADLSHHPQAEEQYQQYFPLNFFEKNIACIDRASGFRMIFLQALAHHEHALREMGFISPDGELTIFTSPNFTINNWQEYDFAKLILPL